MHTQRQRHISAQSRHSRRLSTLVRAGGGGWGDGEGQGGAEGGGEMFQGFELKLKDSSWLRGARGSSKGSAAPIKDRRGRVKEGQ